MKKGMVYSLLCLGLAWAVSWAHAEPAVWDLAKQNADVVRFSTLFTAQDVKNYLGAEAPLEQAVQWCKETAMTHVYLETFRGGYLVPMAILQKAKDRFEKEGFLVSGCITTVGIGKESVNGWIFPCFTEKGGLENLKHIFEYTAMLFDEIMIDDFYATGCECEECLKTKGDKSWADMRTDLLVKVSKEYVLEPSRKVNPHVRIIIKYPQWYDNFHDRGYDVERETAMFDKTWVGTETRDPENDQWGRHPQYMAYFIMRWLLANGGEKCGGGWFDPYGTSPSTYVEQARQTLLGGAKEALLFCYGSLQNDNGPENVKAFREEIPELFALANAIQGKALRGIHTPKLPNSEGKSDRFMFDFLGMLGLPLLPATSIDPSAPNAILGYHALKDENALEKIRAFRNAKKPVLMTDTLVKALPEDIQKNLGSLIEWHVPGDPWDWMNLGAAMINENRNLFLKPFGVEMDAPSRVALYLFGENLIGIENFNEETVSIRLAVNGAKSMKPILTIRKEKSVTCDFNQGQAMLTAPGRTLVLLEVN